MKFDEQNPKKMKTGFNADYWKLWIQRRLVFEGVEKLIVDFEGLEIREAQREFPEIFARLKPLPRNLFMETTPGSYDEAWIYRRMKLDNTNRQR